ncbi:hypothetical protein C8J57DRAFT_1241399 [Mycena rebaudengoi]|nr:hypothetical protein C8J57DRAFT_1241399 [Mycena rebaudengoi]
MSLALPFEMDFDIKPLLKKSAISSANSALLPPLGQLVKTRSSRIELDLFTTLEPPSASIIDLCSPSPKMTLPAPRVKPEIVDLTLSPVQQKTTRIQVDFKPETGEPTLFQPSEPSEPRSLTETIDAVRVGSFFASFKKGKDAHTGQTKRGSDGSVRRITLRCNHYGQPKATHLMDVDPSDHRCGFTKRTDCSAHVNLVALPGGGWHANVVDFTHNHPPKCHWEVTFNGLQQTNNASS